MHYSSTSYLQPVALFLPYSAGLIKLDSHNRHDSDYFAASIHMTGWQPEWSSPHMGNGNEQMQLSQKSLRWFDSLPYREALCADRVSPMGNDDIWAPWERMTYDHIHDMQSARSDRNLLYCVIIFCKGRPLSATHRDQSYSLSVPPAPFGKY